MPNILYLVHDLTDPAVRRRVDMLEAGGASVTVAGFTRAEPPASIGLRHPQNRPLCLGRTRDGNFPQRIAMVARTALSLRRALATLPEPDLIIGRNLEMLALAHRAARLGARRPPVVYECLDIHRLMLGGGPAGRAMRAAERALASRSGLLMTSSPAFLREYFEPRGQAPAASLLVENKVLELGPPPLRRPTADILPAKGEKWRIGWFGALRCARSLAALSAFTRAMDGAVEIVLRGRPARGEFADFDALVAAEPHIRFEGPYRNPEDLAQIYGEVHFAWAIDFFEEGQNSRWLLPNRLYESCRHGAVPVALAGTETGRVLAERGLGIVLDTVTPTALSAALPLAPAAYAAARAKVLDTPDAEWICGPDDCRALVRRLASLARPAGPGPGDAMELA